MDSWTKAQGFLHGVKGLEVIVYKQGDEVEEAWFSCGGHRQYFGMSEDRVERERQEMENSAEDETTSHIKSRKDNTKVKNGIYRTISKHDVGLGKSDQEQTSEEMRKGSLYIDSLSWEKAAIGR